MARRLAAVPEVAPRAIGLIRVSKMKDRTSISPETQQIAITDYSAGRGYQLTGWLEGLDESGSRARSAWWPRLDQAIAAVEAGEYDVIVVWEFSRAARNRLRWAMAIDRVETAGGRLESASERVDASTASGRLQRGVLAEFHTYRAEAIGESWKNAHAARIRAGKPANGKPRWGYRYDLAEKIHKPDPETGPVLADMYRRYVAGDSVYTLVRWLNAHGWRTQTGGLWSDRSLRRVLDSGFAAGKFMAHGELLDGVHEPLIDAKLWLAYEDARVRRRAAPPRRERSQYLLSGLVRCARCERPMVAGQFGHGHAPKYRCKTGKEQGPEACAGGYVMASYVEAEVKAKIEKLAKNMDERQAAALAVKAKRTAIRSDTRVVARQLARAEESLARLAVQNAEHPLPESVYQRAHRELLDQVDALEAELEGLERGARRAAVNPRVAAQKLLDVWDEWPVAQRRELLGQLVERVMVRTGRPKAHIDVVMTYREDELEEES